MSKYFSNCSTLDELKKEYHKLAMIYHPDCGGPHADTAIMSEINAEHDAVFVVLQKAHNEKAAHADNMTKSTEAPNEFRDIIEMLLKLDGINVELCGCWLWISGNTKPHKETLKAAGCRWAAKKSMWSWHHAEDGSHFFRGRKSIDQIRNKYGSQTFGSSSWQANALEA